MQRLEATATPFAVASAILWYSLCSSTLLLANKMTMVYLPYPSLVSFIQILSSAIIVYIIKFLGVHVDELDYEKIKAYTLYIVAFVASIYANMKALNNSNVETVIVFRACSPISVCVIEYLFMDRALPTLRSALSLSAVAIGAIIYCLSDSQLKLEGFSSYTWVMIYFVMITFEMTYGKKLTSSVKMDTVWGPVLYCNILAILPMYLLGNGNGEFETAYSALSSLPFNGVLLLIFSCIAGTLIGYTGWLCRGMVSATTFTLVGVVNKFLTVLLNVIVWDKHSSTLGLISVCACLLSGSFYQQAPLRNEVRKAEIQLPEMTKDPEAAESLLRK